MGTMEGEVGRRGGSCDRSRVSQEAPLQRPGRRQHHVEATLYRRRPRSTPRLLCLPTCSQSMQQALTVIYPCMSAGLEEFFEPEEWDREKVFSNVHRYKCSTGTETAKAAVKADWEAMHVWMQAHEKVESITIGAPLHLETGAEINTMPTVSWAEAWASLPIVDAREAPRAPGAPPDAAQDIDVARLVAALKKMRAPDREALLHGTTAAQLNVVNHAGYTNTQRQTALNCDPLVGKGYLLSNIGVRGAIFFIELEHFEGEWKVGLGRRTFNETLDHMGNVEVEWFELKKARARQGTEPWPKNPIFQQTRVYRGNSRQLLGMKKSVEKLADFLNVAVTVTAKSVSHEPRLTADSIRALTMHATHLRRDIEGWPQQ